MIVQKMKQTCLVIALSTGTALTVSSVHANTAADDPYLLDNTPITVTGTITTSYPDAFEVTYDNDSITVEMDDWDSYDESKYLNVGEKVTVFGDVDQDFYETRKIEASTVYSHDRSAYYFANDVDEEDYMTSYYYFAPDNQASLSEMNDGAYINATGMIEDIDGREFTLDYNSRDITVDTDTMSYNPFSTEGFRQLEEGDKVYVSGFIDKNYFENKEIQAEYIVSLNGSHNAQ